ncbi:MAG: universal stress protein [Hyphomonadaceae bacterium]
MTFKSLVAVAGGLPEDRAVLTAAARLAAAFGGAAEALPAFGDPAADYAAVGIALSGGAGGATLEKIRASERTTQEQIEALAAEITGSERAPVRVLARELVPAAALARATVLGDLVVFGAGAASEATALRAMFAETLIANRAPALVVKSGDFDVNGRIAVAWDASPQAGRAVRAALPLLLCASEIVIIQCAADLGAYARAGADPVRLRDYLALHGAKTVRIASAEGANVNEALLRAASGAGAGLIVAGAYGHPRFFELALGGTTQALIKPGAQPHVLLAH